MIEILMLSVGIAIWFVLGFISTLLAYRKLNKEYGFRKYTFVNKTGRKRSNFKVYMIMLVGGPYTGVLVYHVMRTMIEMHQGKIYLEEV